MAFCGESCVAAQWGVLTAFLCIAMFPSPIYAYIFAVSKVLAFGSIIIDLCCYQYSYPNTPGENLFPLMHFVSKTVQQYDLHVI